jgi:hypothetical protein
MREPTLFDAAREARDLGMARVETATSDVWKHAAFQAIERLAATGEPFISDDVWNELGASLSDVTNQRALGPVMMSARKKGIIEKTGGYRPSVRSNLSPKPLWVGVKNEDSS